MASDGIEVLVGETLTEVVGMAPGSEEVLFTTASGKRFRMAHSQDCCESVSLEDVVGDPTALVGHPLFVAREDTNSDEVSRPVKDYVESWTWTFYSFATTRGWVVLRWLGQSNGYYSERVDFSEVK